MAQPMPEPNGICHCCAALAHLYTDRVCPPGIYLERHALISDGRREFAIMDMGGVLSLGGVDTSDPQAIEDLAAWLTERAKRLRERQADPRYEAVVAPIPAAT